MLPQPGTYRGFEQVSLDLHFGRTFSKAPCSKNHACCIEAVFFCRLAEMGGSLQKLSLDGNPKLSQTDLACLLSSSAGNDNSQLHTLRLVGCGLRAPLNIELIDAVNDKLSHTYPLRYKWSFDFGQNACSVLVKCSKIGFRADCSSFRLLDFTCEGLSKNDVESLTDVWRDRWANEAKCNVQGNRIMLTVTDVDM